MGLTDDAAKGAIDGRTLRDTIRLTVHFICPHYAR
jgi:hypothetical protein